MTRVKICGITNLRDARAAAAAGADALGFVFAPSPRRIDPGNAREIIRHLPPFITTVGVFVDSPVAEMMDIKTRCGLDVLQLHGDEPVEILEKITGPVIKTISVGKSGSPEPAAYPCAAILLDTYVPGTHGGTGKTFDWYLAADWTGPQPLILAGGLTPENVIEAINQTRPYAVDTSSGVELEPGVKNHEKIRAFIRNIRRHNDRQS